VGLDFLLPAFRKDCICCARAVNINNGMIGTGSSLVSSSSSTFNMTSPSQPLNIARSPARGLGDLESQSASVALSIGTPDLRAIRAQFSGIPPNIPARGSATPSLHPASSSTSLRALQDRSSPRTPQLISGLSATRESESETIGTSSETPPIADLDGLPAEEKAKVLERHLVSKEQRTKAFTEGNSFKDSVLDRVPDSPFTISRRSSNGLFQRQKDLEPFPIPYDAPGADVT
jgi:solute carrier family 36 (proton-coupled amino acid transporter)